ncbi:MAG TPA: DUF72 domain-containing protein [Firmicutes bacterium]|nr:DUF72 domain-containing protein [Bacillota bacterium]
MILVGTAGFSYPDWRGRFYPERLPAQAMLGFYAEHFPFVEVNTTFYRLPAEGFLAGLARRTPEGFLFVIKAFQGLTHQFRDLGEEGLRAAFALQRQRMEELAKEGRLAGLLIQFPSTFRRNPPNEAYLRRWREEMKEWPLVVEFRHRSWLAPEVEQLLRDERLAFAAVDEPRLPGLLPPVVWATAQPGYVRFHGRNAAKWWTHQQSYERYDYLYSEDELRQWVPPLRRLEAQVGTVLVAMNNHYQGKAPQNAKMLRELLDRGENVPERRD